MKRPAAGQDAGADPELARAMSRSHLALDLHRRLPRRNDSDFAYLLDWLEEAEIDRVGCFKYEPVAGRRIECYRPAVPDEISRSAGMR